MPASASLHTLFTSVVLICYITTLGARGEEDANKNWWMWCYGELGCFHTGWPFTQYPDRPISLLPLARDWIDTRFHLYTRSNVDNGHQLVSGDFSSISTSNFAPSRLTQVLIHGFMSSGDADWIINMKNELLSADDYNVIIVDWNRGSTLPYTQATANTRLVGAEIALLLNFLKNEFSLSTSSLHLIGHSLGAHAAGYAGERIDTVRRITGLDPAEPYFQNTQPEVRLDRSDAHFVDVIHTDASRFTSISGFGMDQAVGHADFYPNGGRAQPGCSQNQVSTIEIEGISRGELLYVACNHGRAHEFFSESIGSPCRMWARECASYEEYARGQCDGNGRAAMGMWAAGPSYPVTYYTDTNAAPPYCRGSSAPGIE